MSALSPWVVPALMAAAMALVSLPFFSFLDEPPGGGERVSTLDGLRGFLALAVFAFHLAILPGFHATGEWRVPDARFVGALGPVGVSLFFMVTGFLFWGRLLRTQGRPGWRRLYLGRLFRIAPMYLVVVIAMLGVVFARSGFALREPPAQVLGAVLQWLALGLIDTQPDVNGEAARHVLAGVTWTLWYEWVFYALLPVWAAAARWRRHLGAVLVLLFACLAAKRLWQVDALGLAALFAIGMVVASLRHAQPAWAWPRALGSSVAALCLAGAFAAPGGGYGTGTALLLGVFFHAVCAGATLFGLLGGRGAQRLGTVSYSLYLMQGLLLTALWAIAPVAAFAQSSPAAHGAVGIVGAVLLVLASAAGYAGVERPGIALGRHVAALARRPRPSASSAASSPMP
ncbi:acyltransferase [uncultured Piscinibacter sp.]|uniref:acyltransferase family protein n=1 Tax=uncultured Piscinibacter sp. TaxID=1131835 RepID=UPI0026018B1F|nr:acyltransferase [uncultured Piscinibacter sp.]